MKQNDLNLSAMDEHILRRSASLLAMKELDDLENDNSDIGAVIDPNRVMSRIKEILVEMEKKENQKAQRAILVKHFSRAAVIFLILAIGFSFAFVNVEAFRLRVLHLFYDVTEYYTDFNFVEEASPGTFDESSFPGYLPPYLSIDDARENDVMTTFILSGDDDKALSIQIMSGEGDLRVDSENSDYQTQLVANVELHIYIKKDWDKKSIFWASDNHMNLLIGNNIPLDDLIAVAESLIIANNP